jgi:glutathione S-transferase
MDAKPLLVIGNKNYSSWSLRPWLLLRHRGVAFDELKLPLDTPEFERDIGQWSPSRAVPALRHGDITVWDSLAICEYANETFLDDTGWPRDAAARAFARSISAEMHSGFQPLRTRMPLNVRRRLQGFEIEPAVRRNIERIFAIWRECRSRFGARGPFLFGEFSIADAMYAPVALRFITYGVDVDAVARAWTDTLLALPSLQEWIREAQDESGLYAATDAIV